MSSILKDDQYFNNESDFCRVSGTAAKEKLEKIFLENRISYFVKWDDRPFLSKLFSGSGREKNVFIIRINNGDIAKAAQLVKGLQGVTVIGKEPEHDWSPKEKLLREQQALRDLETDEDSYEGRDEEQDEDRSRNRSRTRGENEKEDRHKRNYQ